MERDKRRERCDNSSSCGGRYVEVTLRYTFLKILLRTLLLFFRIVLIENPIGSDDFNGRIGEETYQRFEHSDCNIPLE